MFIQQLFNRITQILNNIARKKNRCVISFSYEFKLKWAPLKIEERKIKMWFGKCCIHSHDTKPSYFLNLKDHYQI